MATVKAHGSGKYSVDFDKKEDRALARLGVEPQPPIPVEMVLQTHLTTWLAGVIEDHLNVDGPVRLQKFAALPQNKQDVIDHLLDE